MLGKSGCGVSAGLRQEDGANLGLGEETQGVGVVAEPPGPLGKLKEEEKMPGVYPHLSCAEEGKGKGKKIKMKMAAASLSTLYAAGCRHAKSAGKSDDVHV